MRTRITQNIDGYDIIIGIGEAQIDGVATEKVITPLLKETAEYVAVENAKAELSKAATERYSAQRECGKIQIGITMAKDENVKKQLKLELQKASLLYQQKAIEQKEKEEALKPLAQPLIEKRKELFMANPVYFQPKEGEAIITPEEAETIEQAMTEATSKNCYLDVNMKQLCDNRGKTAWIKSGGKWSKREITKIGDEIKSGEITEVNDEIIAQLETERIAGLTLAQKAEEKARIISGLLAQSIQMKTGLEIQGDSAALQKSQDWYNAEVSKVEEKYGA